MVRVAVFAPVDFKTLCRPCKTNVGSRKLKLNFQKHCLFNAGNSKGYFLSKVCKYFLDVSNAEALKNIDE